MATLEQTKFYGLQERTQTLMDLSRNRLNSPTPHQVRNYDDWAYHGEVGSSKHQQAHRPATRLHMELYL